MATPAVTPVLVYDRIASNRRATWILLALSAVLLLPVALPATEYLVLWAYLLLGPLITSVYVAVAISVLTIIAIVVFEYVFAARLVLRAAKARPLAPGDCEDLRRIVENLSIGTGLQPPAIRLVETPALNALSVGLDPRHATIVVTRGLVARLDRNELEAVIAHELAHIANHDTRLGTLLAMVVATFWVPARLVRRLFAVFYGIHPALWIAALLWCGFMLAFSVDGILSLASDIFRGEWFWLLPMALSGYVTFGSPFVAILLRRWMWRQREELADADAVLLTRYPPGLQNALTIIAPASALDVNPGVAHLYIADPLAGSNTLADRLFSAHPPISERIALIERMGPGVSPQTSPGRAATIPQPVSTVQILLQVETWPRKVYAALALLFGPTMFLLGRGLIPLLVVYEVAPIAVTLLALWVVLRWRTSRDVISNALEGPLFR